MRTNEPFRVRLNNINSLSDLQREKERLQNEISHREESIKNNYQNLVHLLSFRNLIGTLIGEVSTTATVMGKMFSLGKDFLAKRKKHKKDKHDKQIMPDAMPNDQIE
ncbi:MAG: hypothetical protein WCI48_04905 [Bacteroidota bacterium]|jgi:hypothetical protein